jgi:hypothetical protein
MQNDSINMHVFIDYDKPHISCTISVCKYCYFQFNYYHNTPTFLPGFMPNCISDDEKIIKDIIE